MHVDHIWINVRAKGRPSLSRSLSLSSPLICKLCTRSDQERSTTTAAKCYLLHINCESNRGSERRRRGRRRRRRKVHSERKLSKTFPFFFLSELTAAPFAGKRDRGGGRGRIVRCAPWVDPVLGQICTCYIWPQSKTVFGRAQRDAKLKLQLQ